MRPTCDLGHELDHIAGNHVVPDEYAEHFPPGDPGAAAQIEKRKAYIREFFADRPDYVVHDDGTAEWVGNPAQ